MHFALAVVAVVALAWVAWNAFGEDSAVTAGDDDDGAGDDGTEDGGSEDGGSGGNAGGGGVTPPPGDDDESADKLTQALTGAKLGNWAETTKRWHAKSKEADKYKADLDKANEELQKLRGASTSRSAREEAIEEAVKRGFKRSEARDFLDTHSVEQLREAMDETDARITGKGEKESKYDPRYVQKLEQRLAKLEERDQDLSLAGEITTAVEKYGEGEDDEFKGTVAAVIEREVRLARLSKQKLPNIDEAARHLSDKLKAMSNRKLEKFKEDNKGSSGRAVAGDAEVLDSKFQQAHDNEDEGVQKMYKHITAPD